MDYCKSHFGKGLDELVFQDVEDYFLQERIETDQLEFKSISPGGDIKGQVQTIQKSVCAFLNSSGGLIIWGAPGGQKIAGKKEKSYKGSLTKFNQVIEKDIVVSTISDGIIPLPNFIRIKILEKQNRSIVILEVDNSDYSPHQTGNTYYMRIDGQTKPAPHHYIESLFRKIKYPNLESILKINNLYFHEGNYKLLFDIIFFNWSPLQNEEKLAFRILSHGIFEHSKYSGDLGYDLEGHESFNENVKDVFYYGEPVIISEILHFNEIKLKETGNKTSILISFGGKYSPRKSSEYVLDFTKRKESDLNSIIISKNENRLARDIHEEKGMNKEKIIEALQNRLKY